MNGKGVFCSDLAHSTLSPFFVHRREETELGNEKSGVVVLLKSQPRERELLGHSNAGHKYKLGELHILSLVSPEVVWMIIVDPF